MSVTSPTTASDVLISVSAPGKVILHGEHSVVYGKLAIAASLGLRTKLEYCKIDATTNINTFILEFSNLNLMHKYSLEDVTDLLNKPLITLKQASNYNFTHPECINYDACLREVNDFVTEKCGSTVLTPTQLQALTAFFYLLWAIWGSVDVRLEPCKISLSSALTISAGTGSSASFAVATVGFLLQYIKIYNCKTKGIYKTVKNNTWTSNQFDKDQLDLISKWAFQSEKIIHGTPSGVDNTICTFGGLVEFRKGTTPKQMEIITKFKLILINTKVPRNTKALVKNVADLKTKFPKIVEGVLELMEETAVEASSCLKNINTCMGDDFRILDHYERLGGLVIMNQNLLRCLGVSHSKLDEACQILEEAGLHGKLTGAGGGGFAICMVSPITENSIITKVIENLNSKGFVAVLTDLGGSGVAVDV